jgi:hypothetical protein
MISVQYGGLALAAQHFLLPKVCEYAFSIPIAIMCAVFFLALAFGTYPLLWFYCFIAVCFFGSLSKIGAIFFFKSSKKDEPGR